MKNNSNNKDNKDITKNLITLKLEDFNFDLPDNLIAQAPLLNREDANVLLVKDEEFVDLKVNDIINLLQEEDLLVFNNTKVIPARLNGKKGEAKILVTLHYCLQQDVWLTFVKNSKRLKVDDIIIFAGDFQGKVLNKLESGEVKIEFIYNKQQANIFGMLDKYGYLPLPPYIKRDNINNSEDKINYQSIFAKIEGAVAAPTASLHFTENLIKKIDAKGIKRAFVTLHVGAGTFLPVTSENVLEHKMHKEYGEISEEVASLINETKARGGKIIAVGTTPLRVLEYVAKEKGKLQGFNGEIDLFIVDNYNFKIVDKLITNFHLPKSTLFMLVSAFCGLQTMKKAYQHAISKSYRFFSYGDCCFLNKKNKLDCKNK